MKHIDIFRNGLLPAHTVLHNKYADAGVTGFARGKTMRHPGRLDEALRTAMEDSTAGYAWLEEMDMNYRGDDNETS